MMSTSSQSSPQTCTPLYTCVRSTAVHWAMRCWIHLARARRTNGRSEMSQLIPRCIACVSSVWWWSNIILTTKFFDIKSNNTHITTTFIQCQTDIERSLSWTSCDASSTNEKNGVLDAFYDFSSATFEIYPQEHSPQNINNIASKILFVCIILCAANISKLNIVCVYNPLCGQACTARIRQSSHLRKSRSYLIFVIFFTRAKFLENKIYTEKRQFFALNL